MDSLRQAEENEPSVVCALRGRAFSGNPAWFARHDRSDPWRATGANYVAVCEGQLERIVNDDEPGTEWGRRR